MNIQVKTARELLAGCQTATSGTHTVITKLANGDASSAQVPYVLDDRGRWNLTKNLELADRIVRNADKNREGVVRELEARNGGKPVSKKDAPELFAEWERRSAAIEEKVESAPFLRVKRSWLKESNENPIPGVVINALRPVLNDDTPAPAAEDVIPDDEPGKAA